MSPARIVLVAIATACFAAVLGAHHYGSASSEDEGYWLGVGASSQLGVGDGVQIAVETRGQPGEVFGQVVGPFGALTGDTASGLLWCPAGASDIDCGA